MPVNKKKTLSIFDTSTVGNPLSERQKGNIFDINTANQSADGLRHILGNVYATRDNRQPEELSVLEEARGRLKRTGANTRSFNESEAGRDLRSPISEFSIVRSAPISTTEYLQRNEYMFTASFNLNDFVNIEKLAANYFYRNLTGDFDKDQSDAFFYNEISEEEKINLESMQNAVNERLNDLLNAVEEGESLLETQGVIGIKAPPGAAVIVAYSDGVPSPPGTLIEAFGVATGTEVGPEDLVQAVVVADLNRPIYINYSLGSGIGFTTRTIQLTEENRVVSLNLVSESSLTDVVITDQDLSKELLRSFPAGHFPPEFSINNPLLTGGQPPILTIEDVFERLGISPGDVARFDQEKLFIAYKNFVQFLRGRFSFKKRDNNGDLQQINFDSVKVLQLAPSAFDSLLEGGPRPDPDESPDLGPDLVEFNNILNPAVFFDHRTDIEIPLTLAESSELNGSVAFPYYDIQNQYNFYIEDYERASSGIAFASSQYAETTFPNFYIFNGTENESVNHFLKKHDYIGRQLYPGYLPESESWREARAEEFAKQKEYFRNYSDQIRKGNVSRRRSELDSFSTDQKTIYLDKKFDNLYDSYKRNLNYVPFFNKVSFSISNPSTLAGNIANSNIYLETIKSLSQNFNEDFSFKKSFSYDFTLQNKAITSPTRTDDGAPQSIDIKTTRKTDVQILEVEDFLNSLTNFQVNFNNFSSPSSDAPYSFNDSLTPAQIAIREKSMLNFSDTFSEDEVSIEFLKSIGTSAIAEKIKSFTKSGERRNFFDILKGDKSHNEILCYAIEKKALSSQQSENNTDVIQDIFIFNDITNVYDFIDTQVKYSKQYTYNLYAFAMIVGNQYIYDSLAVESLSGIINKTFDFSDDGAPGGSGVSVILTGDTRPMVSVSGKIKEKASVKIAKIRLGIRDNLILDSPPLSPNIYFYPVKDNPSIMKMSFTPTTGDTVQSPISIIPSDASYFRAVMTSQQKKLDLPPQSDQLIHYKKDDLPSFYQIFRIDFRPSSYADFSRATVRLQTTSLGEKRSDSATFIDVLQPNVDYYYTFRTLDVHGSISNPTPVFKVRNVFEDGTYLPIIEEYEFIKDSFIPSKKFRRFLKIEPTIRQSYLSDEQFNETTKIEDVSSINLGLEEKSVFGKQFRTKITSTKTGKKLIVDFKFDLDKSELFNYIRNKTN